MAARNLFRTAAEVVGHTETVDPFLLVKNQKPQLMRNLRRLTESRRRYMKDSERVFEKQEQQLELLKREQEDAQTELRVVFGMEQQDHKDIKVIEGHLARIDRLEGEKKKMVDKLAELKEELRQTDREIAAVRKLRGKTRDATEQELKGTKTMMQVEKEYDVEQQRLDTCLHNMKVLEVEVQHLRLTRNQLRTELRDLDADQRRLEYCLKKEVKRASDNLEGYLHCRANKTILERALKRKRTAFNVDMEKLDRMCAQDKQQRAFVICKNKRRPNCSGEVDHIIRQKRAAANVEAVKSYSQALDDLKSAFDENSPRPNGREVSEEERQTPTLEELNEMRKKPAAKVIKKKLGEDGLEAVLTSFRQLVMENQRLYWRVYHNYELSEDLMHERQVLRERVSQLHAQLAKNTLLPQLREDKLRAKLKAEKDNVARTEEELKKRDDIIQSYAKPLEELMRKVGISDEQYRQLTAPYKVVNERNILRCFGAVERVIDGMAYKETLKEFRHFLPVLQNARQRGLEDGELPRPKPKPPRVHVPEVAPVLPPHLVEDEDLFLELGLESMDELEFISTIPLPAAWDDRPLSRDELQEHIARYMDEEQNVKVMLSLFDSTADA